MNTIEMIISKVALFFYVCFKFFVNVVKLPWFLILNKKFVQQSWKAYVADIINMEKECQARIRKISLFDLQKIAQREGANIFIKFGNRYGNINLNESLAISCVVYLFNPLKIFEIGTYDGFSTYHLMMNSADNAKIYTLNLPVDTKQPNQNITRRSTTEYYGDNLTHLELFKRGIGVIYKNCPQSNKVTQLFGDSLTYDFSSHKGSIDLFFIDGGHSLECIAKDTENAMSCLSENGIIIWHDFNIQHKDIYEFLMKFSRKNKLFWIENTRLAVYFKKF